MAFQALRRLYSKWMQIILVTIVATLAALAYAVAYADSRWIVMDEPIPPIAAKNAAGEYVDLHSMSQKNPVVLNIWATWCTPCLTEMPSLLALEQHAALGGNVAVFALNADAMPLAQVQQILASKQVQHHPTLLTTGEGLQTLTPFHAKGLPTAFVLYKGRIQARVEGELDWAQIAVVRHFVALLKPPMTYTASPTIVLYQPDNPDNLGAILRICACYGAALHIIEPCGFILDARRLKRKALDYGAHITMQMHTSWNAFTASLPATARLVLATTKGASSLYDAAFSPQDWLLFGRESAGVPDHVHNFIVQQAGLRCYIPMPGSGRSLNVAVSVGIMLSHWHADIPTSCSEVSHDAATL